MNKLLRNIATFLGHPVWLALFAFGTLVVAVLGYEVLKKQNERESAADQRSIAQQAPAIQVSRFIAYSPDLSAMTDVDNLVAAGINNARVIPSVYQQRLLGEYASASDVRFLFILFANRFGDARAVRAEISEWRPKSDQRMPAGIDTISDYGPLSSDDAFALLVAAAEGMAEPYPLEASPAEEICISFSYIDSAGMTYDGGSYCASTLPPLWVAFPESGEGIEDY